MYYEVSIKHDYFTDLQEVKSKVDKIIVNNTNEFPEAWYKAQEYANDNWKADNFENLPDITAMKRSRIYEFANKPEDGEKIYLATLDDVFVDDSGKEKHTKYLVGVYADDITKAKSSIDNYMKQGMSSFKLTDLNETKFLCVVNDKK